MRKHQEAKRREEQSLHEQQARLSDIRKDLNHLFVLNDAHERGRLLEGVLNRLFSSAGVLVRESFARVSQPGEGAIEQVDGVIELDGHIYLVEMKWLKEPVGVADVSHHLARVFLRSATRGIFISYSEYTAPAVTMCKEALSKAVVVLCTLEEFVLLMESENSIAEFLRSKIRGAIIDKQPFTKSSA